MLTTLALVLAPALQTPPTDGLGSGTSSNGTPPNSTANGEPATAPQARDSRPLTELHAVYGQGDPAALAVSIDESLLFSAEGTTIRILANAPDGPPVELASVPIEAATVRMRADADRLYVAGGSLGLFALDLDFAPDRPPTATLVDDRGDHVCTDVALTTQHVVALFAARDASFLVAYDRANLKPVARAELGGGTAWAAAVDGDAVYVALGTGGLTRVSAGADGLLVEPGPNVRRAFPVPGDLAYEPCFARDVAVANGTLWFTGDPGLGEVDLSAPWSPETPITAHRLRAGGKLTYGCRIDARGDVVAVGTNAAPNVILDGAGYNAFGKMGVDGTVGDLERELVRFGRGEHLLLLRRTGEELAPIAQAELRGGWRSLHLGAERIYEQHIAEGLVVRRMGADGLELISQTWPIGFAAGQGRFSAARPERLLFGFDSAGCRFAGHLALDAGELRVLPSPGGEPTPLGVLGGEPWVDADGDEWLVDGHGTALRLHRFRHGPDTLDADVWSLPQPADAGGRLGHTYLHSAVAGELVLVSRCGSSDGLLAFGRAELTAAAAKTAPGAALDVQPRFVVATEDDGTTGSARVMRLAVGTAPDGRRIAALAAGWSTRSGAAVLQLFEVRGDGIEKLGALELGSDPGNAIGVALTSVRDRFYAVVADMGQGVLAVDITDPARPRTTASWRAPNNTFDDHLDNALDVVVDGPLAYVACARLGVVCLDLSDPASDPLPVVAVVDTPGLVYGIALGTVAGERVLAVGDHQAGLRIYRAATDGSTGSQGDPSEPIDARR